MKVNPYLNFDGMAEQAFDHYAAVFGKDIGTKMRMRDMPGNDQIPAEELDRIMHVSLPIDDQTVLMGSDILPSMGHQASQDSNCYISLHPSSKEEADRLFAGLSDGGHIEMPMADQFWGDYFGSFVDRWGVKWMINFNPNF